MRHAAALARHVVMYTAYLWDTATHKITATFTDPSGGFLYWMAFGPGGTTLATEVFSATCRLRCVTILEIW